MVKNREISSEVNNVIIPVWKSCKRYRKISENFKTPHTTVVLVAGKYKLVGTVENRGRSGRPHKITVRPERKMIRMVEKCSQAIIKKLQADLLASGTRFTLRTISKTLSSNQLLSDSQEDPVVVKATQGCSV